MLFGFASASSDNLPFHFIGGGLLISFWILKLRKLKFNKLISLYSIFTLYAVISGLFISINKEVFLTHAYILAQLCLISIIVYNLFLIEKNLIYFSSMWIILGCVLIFGPLIGIGGDISNSYYGSRYVGLTNNPNVLAMHINYMLISVLYLLQKLKKQNILKILLILIVILSFGALFLTGSRKAFISFLIILSVFLYYNNFIDFKFNYKKLLFYIIALTFVINYLDNIINLSEDSALIIRLEEDSVEQGTEDRFFLIKEGVKVILKYPITGVGLANWSFHSDLRTFKYSHNYLIEVFANTGLIGLFLIILLYRRYFFYTSYLFKNNTTKSEGIFGKIYIALSISWILGFSWYDAPHHLIFMSVYSAFYYNTYSKNKKSIILSSDK